MLYVKTNNYYEKIRKSMNEVLPQIKIEHVLTDYTLQKLGFAQQAPCIFSMDITWKEYEDMMDELMMLEVWAYYDGEEHPEKPEFKRYEEHGWLWDMFFKAKEYKDIAENVEDIFEKTTPPKGATL